MKAAIISLGSVSSELTAHELKTYFKTVDMLDLRKIQIILGGREPVILHETTPLANYDCVYVKGSFKYGQIASALTGLLPTTTYVPIPAQAYNIVRDKVLTQIVLQNAGIPTPRTFVAASVEHAKELLVDANFPIILKLPSGTHGAGVMFADSRAAASSILDTLATLKQSFLIQEYIDTGGNDIRAFVIGDKVIAAMQRIAAPEEKRSNLHAGGIGKSIELDPVMTRIAIQTARALHLDVCGVDIVVGPRGPLVLEANLSPGLQGITKVSGINVAAEIAKFFASRVNEISSDEFSAHSLVKRSNEIIMTAQYRGDKLVVPEQVSKLAGFIDGEEVIYDVSKKQITIKKI